MTEWCLCPALPRAGWLRTESSSRCIPVATRQRTVGRRQNAESGPLGPSGRPPPLCCQVQWATLQGLNAQPLEGEEAGAALSSLLSPLPPNTQPHFELLNFGPRWLWRPTEASQRTSLLFSDLYDPRPPHENNKASAQGGASIPKGTLTKSPGPRGSGAQLVSCVCGFHCTCHPHPNSLPLCNTNTHSALSPPPPPSPLANCPPPHPSPHPLGIGCQASVLWGLGGREPRVPKWAQWEGRSHVLLSPLLMRPQLWPAHSAPLAPHPPGLAAVPSPSIHPPPHAPSVSRALLPTTPTLTMHSRSLGSSSGSRWRGRGELGWEGQSGGTQCRPKAFCGLPFASLPAA